MRLLKAKVARSWWPYPGLGVVRFFKAGEDLVLTALQEIWNRANIMVCGELGTRAKEAARWILLGRKQPSERRNDV